MGDAVGACADTMTVRPHRPNIVMKTRFLIVQAFEAIEPDPTTRMLTLHLRVLEDRSLMASTLFTAFGH